MPLIQSVRLFVLFKVRGMVLSNLEGGGRAGREFHSFIFFQNTPLSPACLDVPLIPVAHRFNFPTLVSFFAHQVLLYRPKNA